MGDELSCSSNVSNCCFSSCDIKSYHGWLFPLELMPPLQGYLLNQLVLLHGLSLHAYGGKQKLDSTSFLIEKWKCLALNNPAFRDLYNTNH